MLNALDKGNVLVVSGGMGLPLSGYLGQVHRFFL
jgi:hypothetical protein